MSRRMETYTLIPPESWAEDPVAEARTTLDSLGFKHYKPKGTRCYVVCEDELYLERRNWLEDHGWRCHHNHWKVSYVLGEPKWRK